MVAKWCMNDLPPFLLLCLRFIFSTFPLIFFIPKPKNLSWSLMSTIALLLGVCKFSFVFLSLYFEFSPGLASLVLQTQVLFTIILSKIFFKSQVSPRQALGMVIAFMGIGLIAQQTGGQANIIGFACIMIAALFWAFANMFFRKAKNVDAFGLVIWMGLVPPLPLLGLSFIFEGPELIIESLRHISMKGVLSLAFIVVAGTWIGSTLWAYLFKLYDAAIVVPYALLIPVFGMTLSWMVFREAYTLTTFSGCLLVFAGLIINQWHKAKKESPVKHP